MSRKISLNTFVVIVTALLLLAATAICAAKEYSFPTVIIDAQLTADGDMMVTEKRTYDFSGDFSWATFWINKKEIRNISITGIAEGAQPYKNSSAGGLGTYQVDEDANKIEVKWFFRASDEPRTFTFNYTVHDAVEVNHDVAEMYWQFIGDDWESPTAYALVTVRLPGPAAADSVRVWGHGTLQGMVQIAGSDSARWEVSDLPAFRYLEARMTFPPSLVPGATRRSNADVLPSILAEEEEWANQANRVRERAKLDEALALPVLLALVVGFILYYRSYARPRRSTFQGEYYRELPAEYTPAEMAVLWRFRSLNPNDVSATVLDMVRREYLHITPMEIEQKAFLGTKSVQTYGFEIGSAGIPEMPHERMVYELLFEKITPWLDQQRAVTLADLRQYAQKKPKAFTKWYEEWQKSVKDTAAKHDFFDKGCWMSQLGAGAIAVALLAMAFVLWQFNYLWVGVAMIVGMLAFIVLAAIIRRHSPAGRMQYLQWQAFRRFLLHFSNMREAPVLSVSIWEHYLVYAVVLGVAAEVIKQLKVLLPDVSHMTSAYHHGFLMADLADGVSGSFTSAVRDSFTQAHQAAMSAASSGAGRGGGFSGGGGFGGGGGGGRAG